MCMYAMHVCMYVYMSADPVVRVRLERLITPTPTPSPSGRLQNRFLGCAS